MTAVNPVYSQLWAVPFRAYEITTRLWKGAGEIVIKFIRSFAVSLVSLAVFISIELSPIACNASQTLKFLLQQRGKETQSIHA